MDANKDQSPFPIRARTSGGMKTSVSPVISLEPCAWASGGAASDIERVGFSLPNVLAAPLSTRRGRIERHRLDFAAAGSFGAGCGSVFSRVVRETRNVVVRDNGKQSPVQMASDYRA